MMTRADQLILAVLEGDVVNLRAGPYAQVGTTRRRPALRTTSKDQPEREFIGVQGEYMLDDPTNEFDPGPQLKRFRKPKDEEAAKRLILMRGLPGSGKSHRAKEIAAEDPGSQIFSTDDYWGKDYNFDPSKLGEAHTWNHQRAHQAMQKGSSTVIIDNTNMFHSHMDPYVKSARQFGYEVSHEHSKAPWAWDTVECAKRNTHGVPHETIERMKGSYEP
jgi:NEDD4-binding protein 2